MKLEEIRADIVELSSIAPQGSHTRVAKKVRISVAYLTQIRRGENAKTENANNITLLRKIRKEYKKIVSLKVKELQQKLNAIE